MGAPPGRASLVSTNLKKTIHKRKQHLFLLKKGKIWYFFKDQGRSPKKVGKRAEKRIDRDVHTPDNMYCD